ncbi:MAG: autoinducer synthase [Rhodobacteraceae bacterium]|nr:autoinducer synthase [Paracoccaceae bacterium]
MHNLDASPLAPSVDPALIAMFEARKRVFIDLLKWDLPVLSGRYEMDQFDTSSATYLVLTDEVGKHRASTRLLRSDGPHILADLFPVLCEDSVPSAFDIAEITRFCIEPTLSRRDRRTARNQLVSALVDHALASGISCFTAVANLPWFYQIEQFGWVCRALGPSREIGGQKLVALSVSIDHATPGQLAAKGIYDNNAIVMITRPGGVS